MREIIFRGKRLDNGKWIQGDLLNTWDNDLKLCKTILNWEGEGDFRYNVDTETVGQFTGKEISNVKLFEHDRVMVTFNDGYCSDHITIDEGTEMEMYIEFSYGGWYLTNGEDSVYLYSALELDTDIKVIGNIHDKK